MTSRTEVATDPGRIGGHRHARALVAALAVTQTVGYGVLSYAFAVFLIPIARDLHTSTTAVTGAAAVAVLVAAAAAIPVGRFVDRHGGRALMTAGSVLGTLAVLGWSQARTVTALYAVFAAIGLASAMTLYEPAFAVLIHHVDARRRANALLAVTIVAGFASSIFFPLAGLLDSHFGWRGALVVLAAVHAVGTIPLHLALLPRHAPHRTTTRRTGSRAEVVSAALHDPGFWLLAVAFLAHSAAVATIAVHLVTYLVTLGHSPAFAATIAGLLGVLSVTGRLVTTGLRRRYATTAVTAAVFGLQGLAAAALPLTGHTTIGATACVVTFGIGFGVGTISRPALLADRYDTAVYATLAGAIATPATIAKAAAPLGAAALSVAAGTYTPVLVAVAAACTIAATALLLTGRQPATHASPGHSRA